MFLLGGTVCILNDNICLFKPLLDVPIIFINFKGNVATAVYLDVRFFHGHERIVDGRQRFIFHLYEGEGFVNRLPIIGRYGQHRVPHKSDHIVA